MALELRDCAFFGPALPEPFVKFQLEGELHKRKLLPKATGDEGRALQDRWDVYRRKLRALGEQGGDRRAASHVLEPLAERLGYERFEPQSEVITREGPEDGGWVFTAADGRVLRAWSVSLGTDLDAPSRRGRAYRYSPSRVAQRVLLASGERVGLLTDGEELRLLLCDPARPDSHIAIRLDRSGGWREARGVPDSYRLLLALASPDGVAAVPDLAEAARLAQSTVTKKLRLQARRAIEGFLQELLDHPDNAAIRAEWTDSAALARALWREGLILVYRLLFVFKLESSADPARAFSFAATSLWRNTYSPNTALARLVRRVLDQSADSGGFLEGGLRTLWRMFAEGMSSSELEIKPLGGMLFGEGATPLLDRSRWGERGVARLLDALLWTPGDGRTERERVHYGALDVEDLGRVYEALLELEPGISAEPMCRLRRAKLEVVVPVAQGAPYRTEQPPAELDDDESTDGESDADDESGDEDEAPKRRGKGAAASKTKVQFIEEIPAERFFLRVGLGRKASGSYYTPHPFVRFLVQETLGPQLAERSPKENPHPGRILELKVLDPAMGSGHFLVEACRYLGEALYEACRLCDELAVQAEERAEKADDAERERLLAHAAELRKRVEDLPDPDDELLAYLPSRAAEGEESGLSQKKAEALCRRLVAVHCLYGVDKNPLAVELAKLSLWLESYAEGLPLTFMDHRLICGDSLTGPFLSDLFTLPVSGAPLGEDLLTQGFKEKLEAALGQALARVKDLTASIGKDVADLEQKARAKEKLDAAVFPLRLLGQAWAGFLLEGDSGGDTAWLALVRETVRSGESGRAPMTSGSEVLARAMDVGASSVLWDVSFPEVFTGRRDDRAPSGFDVVLGNPPWDKYIPLAREFFASFNIAIMDAPTARERDGIEQALTASAAIAAAWRGYQAVFHGYSRSAGRMYEHQTASYGNDGSASTAGHLDAYRMFIERAVRLGGCTGLVVPSSFHMNEGATGVRRMMLRQAQVLGYHVFLNSESLFDEIGKTQGFGLLVAVRSASGADAAFPVSFGLSKFEDLQDVRRSSLRFTRSALEATSPEFLSFPECPSQESFEVLATASTGSGTTGAWFADAGISLGQELNVTTDGRRFFRSIDELSAEGGADLAGLIVDEGKTFCRFGLAASSAYRYWIPVQALHSGGRKGASVLRRARYFRIAIRAIVGFTEEKSVAAILPPGRGVANSALSEKEPESSADSSKCTIVGVFNAFTYDYLLRLRVVANVNQFILHATPVATLRGYASRIVSHCSLRLTANSDAFATLWSNQLGDAWREPTPRYTWPVLADEDARWAVRAAIDAVVADAYGLDRGQYEHVLSTFSHRSYPKAPELCLAAFDELKALGLEAFTKKHDPYSDIPLNESLPKPVIDLPIPGAQAPAEQGLGPLFDGLDARPATPPRAAPARQPAPRPPAPADNGTYDTIAGLLHARGLITSGDAQDATGLDAAGVRPHLKRLVDEGRAVTEGQRRGMKYRRADG